MILHRLEFEGISTAFPGKASIDFDALGPGLVAFVGDNGNGKSHAMELSGPATLFRTFPSYGGDSFASHIHPAAKLAQSTLTFSTGGQRYKLEVTYDPTAKSGKGQTRAKLFRGDDDLIAGPERLGDVDAKLAEILPSQDVMLASSFACQSRDGSFGDLPKARKKELFMELLGLARLQAVAEAAKARRQKAEDGLDRLRPKVEDLRNRTVRYADVAFSLEDCAKRSGELGGRLEEARGAQTLAVEAASQARDALRTLEAQGQLYEDQRRIRADALADAAQQEAAARSACEANTTSLADADAVIDAASKIEGIDADLSRLDSEIDDAAEKLRPIDGELATLNERRNTLVAEFRRLDTELKSAEAAEGRLADGADLEGDARRLEIEAREAAQAREAAESEGAAREDAAEAERTANTRRGALEERLTEIERRTKTLDQVDVEHPMCAECPLTADTRAAIATLSDIEGKIAALPARSTAAAEALVAHRTQLSGLRTAEATAGAALAKAREALAAVAGDTQQAAKAPMLRNQLAENKAAGQATRARIDELMEHRATLQPVFAQKQESRAQLRTQRVGLAALAARIGEVRAAQERTDELARALETATRRQQDAMKSVSELGPAPDLAPAREAAREAQAAVESGSALVTRLQEELTPIEQAYQRLLGEKTALGDDPAGELAEAEAAITKHEVDAADWSHLEKAFGRDGIQALEIDAAGPSVTAIANDLLVSCYGSRFQLRIDTTEETAKGDKVKEVFDVVILDAESPQGDRKSGSGGEQAILDEALRLAIAIFNTQRSGHETLTLWRDETGGALSPENASRYVHMLRRAREIGGFHQVLFISHSEAVWSQADRQLFFANGQVSADPAAREAA